MGILLFQKQFHEAIRLGQKRTTVRRWATARVRAGQRVFTPGLGYLRVESIERIRITSLNQQDARADGFATLRKMRETIRAMYPDTRGDGKMWWRVTFVWDKEHRDTPGVKQSET